MYDTESPQADDDLYDTESLHVQPYPIGNPVTVYIVLVEPIILGRVGNLHSTTSRENTKLETVETHRIAKNSTVKVCHIVKIRREGFAVLKIATHLQKQ